MGIMYIIIIIGAALVGGGWIAYGIWWYKVTQEEKKQPEKKTEHLDKVRKSFDDYTKKMAEFKLKPYERKKKDPTKWS